VDLEIREITCSTETGLRIRVKVKRNVGAGDLVGMKFLVNNGSEIKLFEIKDITLNELSEGEFYLDDDGQCTVEEVSVAPMFETESGKYVYGNIADTDTPHTPSGEECTISCGNCGDDNGCEGICIVDNGCAGGEICNSTGSCVVGGSGQVCPNGNIESPEVCDDPDYGGETCDDYTGVGSSGSLACINSCGTIDSSGCVGAGAVIFTSIIKEDCTGELNPYCYENLSTWESGTDLLYVAGLNRTMAVRTC